MNQFCVDKFLEEHEIYIMEDTAQLIIENKVTGKKRKIALTRKEKHGSSDT